MSAERIENTMRLGERLRQERLRRHLSQEALAEALGASPKSISRWEHDQVVPQAYVRLQLCRFFGLPPEHLFGDSEAQALPTRLWVVPSPRNPFFTGREELLQQIHTSLCVDHPAALGPSCALHGLGGIGKTHLALEYAYRHAPEYAAVFWITAESAKTILTSFLTIAAMLQLPDQQEADQQRIIVAVQRWLTTHSGWLLIWDNLEEMELLQRFLPPASRGAVLITTQRQALGTLAQGLELPTMTPEEGMLLLLRRAKVLSPQVMSEQMHQLAVSNPTEYAAARELVTVMGGLPLALDQAGAYIEETGCNLSDYLQRYESQRAQLLERRGTPGGDHPHSVASTFRLSSQRVERDHPAAAEVLRLCAFLYAEAIPEELFVAEGFQHEAVEEPVAADSYQLDLTIAALRTFSLVQRHPETRTLSIHRLVQAVIREEMSEQEREMWQQRTLRLLDALFPEVTYEAWRQCERLLPHVLMCATPIPDHGGNQELLKVLRKAADYLRERAQYEQAESLYQRALRIWKRPLEPEHPEVVHALFGLALLYSEQGKYEQAEPLYQRALHIWEQTLGPEHLEMARPLNGLANLYSGQGKYEQAEPLYQRALRIWEQTLGPEHPKVAYPLHNLALLYFKQGEYEQAEPLYQRALAIDEQAYGPQHPDVAYPLHNLADLYVAQGKYEQAEPLYRRALRIWEQALGPEHPQVAYPLSGLATLYREQGSYEQAEPLYQRALAIREQHLGQQHRETAKSLADLARLYEKRGNDEQAMSLLQRACSTFEQLLGRAHPETTKAMSDYHDLLEQRKRATEGVRRYSTSPDYRPAESQPQSPISLDLAPHPAW